MSEPYRLPWHRRWLQYTPVQWLAAASMAMLLRLFWLTFRRKVQTHPEAQRYTNGDAPAIFCLWHGRMILFPFFKPKDRGMHVLISQHRDGEMIARLISHFGIDAVRGSSSKGAAEATRALLAVLAAGGNIAITPDGPRGPAFEVSRGALHLARLSGCPLIPVSYSASRYTQLKSWDQFIIPHPFARVQVEVGAPIRINREAKLVDLQQSRGQLQHALNAVSERADTVRAA